MCAAAFMVTAMTSTPGGGTSVTFPSPGRCSFDAAAATLMQTILSNGGNSRWSKALKLFVRDGTPPVVSSVASSADTVPAGGGNVVVTAQATDDAGVVKMMSSRLRPDGTSNTMEMARTAGSAASGTWTITWAIAANGGPTPGSSTIKVWALDGAGNSAYGKVLTVVVRAGSGQEPQSLQVKKP